MTIQRINFQSIPVDDQDRALAFYTEKLGFNVITDAPYNEGYRWIFLGIPGAGTRLHFARRNEITINDTPALMLVSDDVDAECAALTNNGVDIHQGPDDAPWQPGIRWAMIKDTEGNLILLESTTGGKNG